MRGRRVIVSAAVVTALVAAAASSCSCSDRTVAETGPDPELEERELCHAMVDWQDGCLDEKGVIPEESSDTRFEGCMELFFSESVASCREEAVVATSCEATQTCEDFPITNDSPRDCEADARPFSACRSNPEYWASNNCTADDCPGRCCAED